MLYINHVTIFIHNLYYNSSIYSFNRYCIEERISSCFKIVGLKGPWTGIEEGPCKQGKPGQTGKEKVMNILFNELPWVISLVTVQRYRQLEVFCIIHLKIITILGQLFV